jgi:hypothetical protein
MQDNHLVALQLQELLHLNHQIDAWGAFHAFRNTISKAHKCINMVHFQHKSTL